MKQNNLKIAITGGIGSGKSLACNIIKSKGYNVFSCDEVYADLLCDKNFVKIFSEEFGGKILNVDGTLNRGELSAIVFSDEQKLKRLNEITHPKIFGEMFRRASVCKGVAFFEVPLLFEGGYQELFDNVIVILREESERILSVAARDKISEEEVKKRIFNQYNYDNSNYAQYYVIHNDGNIDDLSDKIDKILLKLANA